MYNNIMETFGKRRAQEGRGPDNNEIAIYSLSCHIFGVSRPAERFLILLRKRSNKLRNNSEFIWVIRTSLRSEFGQKKI